MTLRNATENLATEAKQTSGNASLTSLDTKFGTQADAAWASGNGTVIALLKAIVAAAASGGGGGGGGAVTVASGADVSLGAIGDTAWASGNGTVIALLKALHAKIIAAPSTEAKQDALNAGLGAVADAAWSGSGNATAIAALKAASLSLTTAVTHLSAIKVAAEDSSVAGVAIADGDLATMGLRNDAAWDEAAAAPSAIAIWKRAVLSKDRRGLQYFAATAVTRPADTTAYTGGDVVGGAAAAITFANFGAAGQTTMIFGASMRVDLAGLPAWAVSMRLHLYSATPPSALADNAPWDLPAGDRASYLGFIDMGTPADVGTTCWVQDMSIRFPVRMAGTSLFGYLVSPGGGASAASTAFTITLHGAAL